MNNFVILAPNLLINEDIYSSGLRAYCEMKSNHSEIFMVQCCVYCTLRAQDADEIYAAAAVEAQKLLDYKIDISSYASKPKRISLEPIKL